MRLKGNVAIVTGAGKGIGRGIADVFAREGAAVVIATQGEKSGKEAEQEVMEQGGDAFFVRTDVSLEESVRSMVDEVMKRYGRIDTLVNNAGITLFKPLHEATVDDWERIINVDLRGVFLCSKYVSMEMKKLQKGSIINISSNHAVSTLPDSEIYAAAKSGVNGMTRSMALSLGKYGIRVNALCPGFTNTPHYQSWLHEFDHPEKVDEEVKNLHATGRISNPEDIAKMAVYLASDESEMMTGAELILDGGLSARLYHSKIC